MDADEITRKLNRGGSTGEPSMEFGKQNQYALNAAATDEKPKNYSDDKYSVQTWFERDRSHVELHNDTTDETVVEWWDDEVQEAIDDGFLNPRNYKDSAIKYALHTGLILKEKRPEDEKVEATGGHWTKAGHANSEFYYGHNNEKIGEVNYTGAGDGNWQWRVYDSDESGVVETKEQAKKEVEKRASKTEHYVAPDAQDSYAGFLFPEKLNSKGKKITKGQKKETEAASIPSEMPKERLPAYLKMAGMKDEALEIESTEDFEMVDELGFPIEESGHKGDLEHEETYKGHKIQVYYQAEKEYLYHIDGIYISKDSFTSAKAATKEAKSEIESEGYKELDTVE